MRGPRHPRTINFNALYGAIEYREHWLRRSRVGIVTVANDIAGCHTGDTGLYNTQSVSLSWGRIGPGGSRSLQNCCGG
jgi:hypothetical protein